MLVCLTAQPANDNGGPGVIPVFASVLRRHDMTPMDALVYGVVAAYVASGGRPRAVDIAAAIGIRSELSVRARLRKLEAAGLLRREYRRAIGERNTYILLGPTCAKGWIA